jgi:hypothetical protein
MHAIHPLAFQDMPAKGRPHTTCMHHDVEPDDSPTAGKLRRRPSICKHTRSARGSFFFHKRFPGLPSLQPAFHFPFSITISNPSNTIRSRLFTSWIGGDAGRSQAIAPAKHNGLAFQRRHMECIQRSHQGEFIQSQKSRNARGSSLIARAS